MIAISKLQQVPKGQLFIYLPKEISETLKLNKGDKIGFSITADGRIELIIMKENK